jgi:hypothetical protein
MLGRPSTVCTDACMASVAGGDHFVGPAVQWHVSLPAQYSDGQVVHQSLCGEEEGRCNRRADTSFSRFVESPRGHHPIIAGAQGSAKCHRTVPGAHNDVQRSPRTCARTGDLIAQVARSASFSRAAPSSFDMRRQAGRSRISRTCPRSDSRARLVASRSLRS